LPSVPDAEEFDLRVEVAVCARELLEYGRTVRWRATVVRPRSGYVAQALTFQKTACGDKACQATGCECAPQANWAWAAKSNGSVGQPGQGDGGHAVAWPQGRPMERPLVGILACLRVHREKAAKPWGLGELDRPRTPLGTRQDKLGLVSRFRPTGRSHCRVGNGGDPSTDRGGVQMGTKSPGRLAPYVRERAFRGG
jgi:hypothetical protein